MALIVFQSIFPIHNATISPCIHKSQPVTCNLYQVFQMLNVWDGTERLMLHFRCCLVVGYCLRLSWTFGFNFGRHNCTPSHSNKKFFGKSRYGQLPIGYNHTLTIRKTIIASIFATLLVRSSRNNPFTTL